MPEYFVLLCTVVKGQRFEYKLPAAGQKRSEKWLVSLNGMAGNKTKELIWAHVSHYPFWYLLPNCPRQVLRHFLCRSGICSYNVADSYLGYHEYCARLQTSVRIPILTSSSRISSLVLLNCIFRQMARISDLKWYINGIWNPRAISILSMYILLLLKSSTKQKLLA